MVVVLDTNVLVSGLLNAFGSPGRIVDLAVEGSLRLAFDDRILEEYRIVLARPRFKLDPAAVAEILELLEDRGVRTLAAPITGSFPDADDLKFVEVAIAASAEAVISGNLRHFPPEAFNGMRLLSPADFITEFSAGPRSLEDPKQPREDRQSSLDKA